MTLTVTGESAINNNQLLIIKEKCKHVKP